MRTTTFPKSSNPEVFITGGNSRMPQKYDTHAKRKAMGTSNTTQYDTNITSKAGAEHSERSKKSGNDERSMNLGSEHPWDDHPVLHEVERERSQENTLDDAEKMVVEGNGDNCRVDGDGSRRGQSGRPINLTFRDLEDDNVTGDSKGDLVESTFVRKRIRRAKTNVLDSPGVPEPTLGNNRVKRQPDAGETGTQILRALNALHAEALASLEFCAPLAGRARVRDSCSQSQCSGRERDVCATSQPQNLAGVIVVPDDKDEPARALNPRAYLGKWFEDAKKVGIQNVFTEVFFEMFVKSVTAGNATKAARHFTQPKYCKIAGMRVLADIWNNTGYTFMDKSARRVQRWMADEGIRDTRSTTDGQRPQADEAEGDEMQDFLDAQEGGKGGVDEAGMASRPELERARRDKRKVGKEDVDVRDTAREKRARPTTIDELYAKEKLSEFTDAWLQWIYAKGLSFNAFRVPEFQRVRQAAERVPHNVRF
ncbi:hypothetical protein CBR_g60028 [Chara braunii]|uniref:Uncharacterized protein n=1 Tax=Chara braunii TaxID=69332 RepID=A0A388K8N8_CHABU|nr:hypothetical protein CBR_g60028 [Chara braunii]|eukprot:GBG66376.1 hypothetical protein CBR_g60028 [Chara braunii]